MDGWEARLSFLLCPSGKKVRSAGSGGETERVELKWTLLWMGPNVGLYPWRPWNEAVAQGP